MDLKHIEGRRFCVVFATVDSTTANGGQVKLRPLHGRASVSSRGEVSLVGDAGSFMLPASSYVNIQPSDGTDILGDSEYFVILKVQGMDL